LLRCWVFLFYACRCCRAMFPASLFAPPDIWLTMFSPRLLRYLCSDMLMFMLFMIMLIIMLPLFYYFAADTIWLLMMPDYCYCPLCCYAVFRARSMLTPYIVICFTFRDVAWFFPFELLFCWYCHHAAYYLRLRAAYFAIHWCYAILIIAHAWYFSFTPILPFSYALTLLLFFVYCYFFSWFLLLILFSAR